MNAQTIHNKYRKHIIRTAAIIMRVLEVGPELAQNMLKRTIGNRKVRKSRVALMVRAMSRGDWTLHHQGFAFSSKDKLFDGHHRCQAIIEFGGSVPMCCFWNVADFRHIDLDTPRGAVDILQMVRGCEWVNSKHVSIANALLRRNLGGTTRYTVDEVCEWVQFHRDALAFTHDNFSQHRKGITTAPVKSVVARAYYSEDPLALQEFCDVLITGQSAGEKHQPIVLLREWLTAVSGRGTTTSASGMQQGAYGKTQRALAAFLSGERMKKLFSVQGDLYAIPSPWPEENNSVPRPPV